MTKVIKFNVMVSAMAFSIAFAPTVTTTADEPIEVGKYRQLFVDDHVIDQMLGLERTLHQPAKHVANPLIWPQQPWEGDLVWMYGSVIYDHRERLFKMWHQCHSKADAGCGLYATSTDGLQWEKPALGVIEYKGSKENNLIPWFGCGVIFSPDDPDPSRRFLSLYGNAEDKLARPRRPGRRGAGSADGLVFQALPGSQNIPGDIVGDNVIPVCFDELEQRYIAFGKVNRKSGEHMRRSVSVSFSKDFVEWTKVQTVLVPDARDDELSVARTAQLRDRCTFFDEDASLRNAQFYGLCGFPYEGMYLGLLWVFDISGWIPGAPKNSARGGEDGPVQVELVSSRDLIHWNRVANRKLLIPVGAKGSWEAGTIYTSNRPIIVGDEIRIYYSGIKHAHRLPPNPEARQDRDAQINCGIGLATLRLDGWVSVDAGQQEGTLTTKPLVLKGRSLIVNADAAEGRLAVEILDQQGRPIPGFGKDHCDILRGDAIRHTVSWRGKSDVRQLAGKTVQLRFYLCGAKLYSFSTNIDPTQ